jgi:nucleoside-diphosphate-sugar epimerase
VPGDVTEPLCGLGTLPEPIEQFWHCAASLQYEDRYKTAIYETNLEGTRHALDLARNLGVIAFNYISTAYVAGKRTGLILEQPVAGIWTNNHYEASKVEAEAVVARAHDFQVRILRPSVVIGHSQTFAAANSFSGMYGFMRKLLQFKNALSRVQEGLLSKQTVQMRVDPDALLNLVPIDWVALEAVHLAFSPSKDTFFHLTNPHPPITSDFLFWLFENLELKQPQLVQNRESFSWIDKKLDQGITFYSSYLVGSKTFDRTHTNAASVWNPPVVTLDERTLQAYFHWYLELLAATRPLLLANR